MAPENENAEQNPERAHTLRDIDENSEQFMYGVGTLLRRIFVEGGGVSPQEARALIGPYGKSYSEVTAEQAAAAGGAPSTPTPTPGVVSHTHDDTGETHEHADIGPHSHAGAEAGAS